MGLPLREARYGARTRAAAPIPHAMPQFQKMPRTIWLFLLLLLIAIGQIVLFSPLREQPDTATYAAALQQWSTGENLDRLMRWSRFLSLLLPLALVEVWGLGAVLALLIQQYLAVFLCLLFFYLWLRRQGESGEKGLLLWLCASPVPVYAWAAINDAAGWATALGLLLLLPAKNNSWQALRFGFLLGVAIFVKESALLAGWYWAWLWLWRDRNIRTAAATLLGFALAVGIGLWATTYAFGYNLLDWIRLNHESEEANLYADWRIAYATQLLRTLDVYWIFVACAPFVQGRQRDKASNSALWSASLAAIVVYPFVWAYMSDRILFLFSPLWLLLALRGLRFWGRCSGAALVVAACANLAAAYSSYVQPLAGGLGLIYVLAAFLLGLLLFVQYKMPQRARGTAGHSADETGGGA